MQDRGIEHPTSWMGDRCLLHQTTALLARNEVGCSIPLSCFFFSCPFFNSFSLFSFICFALFYLQLPHYLFTRNYFTLHDTQPNRTIFSFSNSRTLVNQVVGPLIMRNGFVLGLKNYLCAINYFKACTQQVPSQTVYFQRYLKKFFAQLCLEVTLLPLIQRAQDRSLHW